MASLVLGLDVGTTGTNAVLADPASGLVAQASGPAGLSSPRAGWAEADPAQWWRNTCELVPRVLDVAKATATDIAALATTGMVVAVIVTDAVATPLRPAILQNDARAVNEIRFLSGALGHLDLVAVTGSALTQQSVAPTLLWLARHEPGTWNGVGHVLGSYDWLAVALGARPHMERNWALESGLYNFKDWSFLTDMARATGIPRAVLPDIASPGSTVGTVSAAAAEQTGLRAGTPIVTGGADHVLSAYAAGLASPGDWLVKLGGAGAGSGIGRSIATELARREHMVVATDVDLDAARETADRIGGQALRLDVTDAAAAANLPLLADYVASKFGVSA